MSTAGGTGEFRRSRAPRDDGQESEFIEHVVKIYRVAKVVKGGKNLSFSALVVIGDGHGILAPTLIRSQVLARL